MKRGQEEMNNDDNNNNNNNSKEEITQEQLQKCYEMQKMNYHISQLPLAPVPPNAPSMGPSLRLPGLGNSQLENNQGSATFMVFYDSRNTRNNTSCREEFNKSNPRNDKF